MKNTITIFNYLTNVHLDFSLLAYKGLLKCGNDHVRHQKLTLSKNLEIANPVDRQWLEKTIDPEQSVMFLDTDRKGWLESEVDG